MVLNVVVTVPAIAVVVVVIVPCRREGRVIKEAVQLELFGNVFEFFKTVDSIQAIHNKRDDGLAQTK